MVQFDNLTTQELKSPVGLNDQELGFILHHKKMIENWLSAVEKHVIGRVSDGETFSGWKLVSGRSIRKWADEDAAAKKLKRLIGATKAYQKKLLSPAQAEKALGKEAKNKIQKFIVKPEGKPVLVPADDKRPALQLGISANDFD